MQKGGWNGKVLPIGPSILVIAGLSVLSWLILIDLILALVQLLL